MADKLKISITEEAVIRVETDKVSSVNHLNCEQFLRGMASLAGGATSRRHKHGGTAHTHAHEGEHDHEHS